MGAIDIVGRYYPALLSGIWVTAQLCLWTWIIGIPIGILLGFGASRFPRALGLPTHGFAFLLSATPVLILLYWLYYPAPELTGIRLSAFTTAVVVLILYMTSAVSESVRTALHDFPQQFVIAGRVYGLTNLEIARHIQVPLLWRSVLPAVLTAMLSTLHSSLFASLITVEEVFRVAQRINAQEYRPIPVFTLVAVFFLLVCIPLHAGAVLLRRRFGRDLSER